MRNQKLRLREKIYAGSHHGWFKDYQMQAPYLVSR
jgi:hypothetical protein